MTTHIKQILLFLIATFVLQGTTFATERDVILTAQAPKGTLVRDLGDKSMICNQIGESNGSPSFTLYNPGVSTAPEIFIDIDTILDFEVYNDTIYFCGVKSNATGGYGILGYFPISGFPLTTVSYLNVPIFRRVRKMEVGNMMGHTHMVAIGDGIHGKAELVDANNLGSVWDMNFFDANDKEPWFVDLAITDNYVLVASTIRMGITIRARIFYFDKPTTPGGTLGPTAVPWRDIYNEASTHMIIEPCIGDAFVVAMTSGINLIGQTSFIIVAYDGYNTHISTNRITEYHRKATLEDIEYYDSLRVTELLLYIDEGETKYSVIYNLTSAMSTGNLSATGRIYDKVCLNSLDKKTANARHFLASGINKTGFNYIEHIIYDFIQWTQCSDYHENMVSKQDPFYNKDDYIFGLVSYGQKPVPLMASDKYVYVNNKCDSKD